MMRGLRVGCVCTWYVFLGGLYLEYVCRLFDRDPMDDELC